MEHLYRRWEWAEGNIDGVCREASSFLLKKPCVIETQDDVDGNRTFRVRTLRSVPNHLSLMLGDTLQALRSPLDNLVWDLALKQTATPPESTRFPITRTPVSWNSAAGQLNQVIAAPALAIIDQVQPYHADPDANPLWQLHRLAIEDRHRTLVLAFHVATSAMFTAWGPPGNKPNPELHLGAVADGDQIGLWKLEGDWIQLGLPPISFTWDLAFDQAGPARGRLICSGLLEYSNAVRSVLDQFQQFFP
jgi:hypothetical protein